MQLPDILEQFSSSLSQVSRTPNIYSYVPNPNGQEQFHRSDSKGRLLVGSNRGGKSVAGSVEASWWMTGTHPYLKTPEPPVRLRVVTVDFNDGEKQIIVPLLQQWIPKSFLIDESWESSYNKKEHRLTLKNGSSLQIKTFEQSLDTFAGVPLDAVWFDEEPPKAIFRECLTRLIDRDGKYWLTMTPVEGMTWVFDDLVQKDNNVEVIKINIKDNKHIKSSSIAALGRDLDEEETKIRIEGEFVPRGGLVLREFDYEKNVIKPGIPDKGWDWYVSLDHGYNNPTAVYWHAISLDATYVITFKEHYRSFWIVSQHAEFIHEVNKDFNKQPTIYIGDPSITQRNAVTGRSIQIEYRDAGIPIALANNEVKGGLNKMNEYLKQVRWLITADCVNLLKEIRKYRWKTYQSSKVADQNNPREEPNKKDDHGIDSCRYLFSFLPVLDPLPEGIELPKLTPFVSKTVTDRHRFPWTIDSYVVQSHLDKEPDVGFGEVL